MTNKIIIHCILIGLITGMISCKKDPVNVLSTGNFSDTTGELKNAADFPIGFALDYTPFMNDAAYRTTIAREADMVTFSYNMKHGAIVRDDGTFNFANTDALFNAATADGLQVYGHTLVWHQNQNANYLNTLMSGSAGGNVENLLKNGDFEAGSGNSFTNWSAYNGGAAMTAGSGTNEVHGGVRSLKATVTASGQAYAVQMASDLINTTIGSSYKLTFWIKSATAGGKMRVSTATTAQYSPDYNTTTDWTQVTWTISAKDAQTRILFDVGSTANTYYIDDVVVSDPNAATSTPSASELIINGNFEAGTGNTFTNWSAYNGGTSLTAGSGANEVHGGARSLKATVTANGQAYAVQMASDLFNTTVGTSYKLSFWIKSAAAGGKMRVSTGTTAQYSSDYNTTTDWSQMTWTITAKDPQTRILFDLGSTANTYFIDDVSVVDASSSSSGGGGGSAMDAVDSAMSRFIRASVTRYAGKVKAWDVVNEPMADGSGALRTKDNTTIPAGSTDYFIWQQYLGRDYALKAFKYAKAADPNAMLFINEYNLESSTAKLDSLIAYVKELQAKGAPIDGIGTQMHISINASYTGIDAAFQKLAATGLKIRISELDVRVNPSDKQGFTPIPTTLAYQAAMYNYVISSYMKYVPAAQRHGVTIWGVADQDSWIRASQKKVDNPLLFNNDYSKKPAYSGVLQGLRSQ